MFRLVALAAIALLTVSACGDSSGGDAPGRDSAVSGGKAATYILKESELPAGWRLASGEQYLGIPKSCGVTLEPPALASAETQRFTQSATGPFVIQYSFVSSDEKATAKRIDQFVKAARTCTGYEPEKGVTVFVRPNLDVVETGDAFASVHEADEVDKAHQQDIVVFRNGPAVTVLQSYSPATLAEHSVLSEMAATISAKHD